MNHHDRRKCRPGWCLLPFVCLPLVLAGCTRHPTTAAAVRSSGGQPESTLTPVWDALHKGKDYGRCRTVVQLLNDYLNRNPGDRPSALTDAERTLLRDRFQLTADELAEVESPTFTLFDAHHLEDCLLLRDAAGALRPEGLPPLDRATAAFAWVVRQLRLYDKPGMALPPTSALRRGGGSARERDFIFLGLLEQLDLEGCMVALPAAPDQAAVRYWLPGVLIDKEIYLFDTRLGLPLPGLKGSGVATLAQLRSQPDLLQALPADDKNRYDVTAEQARKAEPHFACPLSALAPRMRWLQERMAAQQKVQLGLAAAARLASLEAAIQGPAFAGAAVRVWNRPDDPDSGVRIARSTVPPEEGGSDKAHRRGQWMMEQVPLNYMPLAVRDMPGDPGRRLRDFFARSFLALTLDPSMPREQVLRGQYQEATARLVQMRDAYRRLRSEFGGPAEMERQLAEWRDRAIPAYANLVRAQGAVAGGRSPAAAAALQAAQSEVEALWKEVRFKVTLGTLGELRQKEVPQDVLEQLTPLLNKEFMTRGSFLGALMQCVSKEQLGRYQDVILNEAGRESRIEMLVQAAATEPLLAETTYHLSLCQHERAERAQAALERSRRAGKKPSGSETTTARDAWQSAADWWGTYLDDHPNGAAIGEARVWRAEALAALGETATAVALLKERADKATGLDRVACLYRLKRLQGQ
jgi:hypothetical protein